MAKTLDALFFTPNNPAKPANDSDQELVQRIRNLFTLARDNRRVRYDNWIRNYRIVNNRLGGQPQSNWMPAPRDSEIYPVLSSMAAHMTDQNVNIDFVPACDPNTSMYQFQTQLCDDLSAVLYSTWLVENYDAQVALGLWDTFMYGVGIYKNVWDNALSRGYGNATLRRVDPWSFYPDPDATSFDDMNFCFEVRKMSYDEIERRFPDRAPRLLDQSGSAPDQIDERPRLFSETSRFPMANAGANMPSAGTYPGSTPTVQGRFSMAKHRHGTHPLPSFVVYECWVRENDEYYDDEDTKDNPYSERHINDRWRVIVMCNGLILMDELAEDLTSHAQHPYERYVFDDIGEFYGISLVDHLAYPQIYINRLLTAMQHSTELTGNPVLVEAANSGTSRVAITNKPGQRLTLQGAGAMANSKPEWLEPPSMPDMAMKLVEFWIARIENTSGLRGAQKGEVPNQRTSTDTVSMAQEAAFVRVRAAIRNLEYTLQGCAIKLSDLIVDNYTEPRIMAILGQDGKKSALALAGRHFYVPGSGGTTPLKYTLQIRAGSSMPTSRNARIAESEKLLALGAVDDQYVLEAHQVRAPEKILQRLYYKRQNGLVGAGPGMRQRTGRSQ